MQKPNKSFSIKTNGSKTQPKLQVGEEQGSKYEPQSRVLFLI